MTGSAQILSARVPGNVEYIAELPHTTGFGVVVVDDFPRSAPRREERAGRPPEGTSPTRRTHTSKLVIVGINRAGDALVRHAPDLAARLDVLRFEVEPPEKLEQVVHLGEGALNVKLSAGARSSPPRRAVSTLSRCSAASSACPGNHRAPDEHIEVTAPYGRVKHRVMEQQERRFGARRAASSRAGLGFAPAAAPTTSCCSSGLRVRPLGHRAARRDRAAPRAPPLGWAGRRQGMAGGHAAADDIARGSALRPPWQRPVGRGPPAGVTPRNLDWQRFRVPSGSRTSSSTTSTTSPCPSPARTGRWPTRSYELLDADDYVVFYDLNEQARIVGEDVEAFLAPIYASDSRFVDRGARPYVAARSAGRSSRADQFRRRTLRRRTCHPDLGQGRPAVTGSTKPADIGYLTFDSAARPAPRGRTAPGERLIKEKHTHVMRETTGTQQIQLDSRTARDHHRRTTAATQQPAPASPDERRRASRTAPKHDERGFSGACGKPRFPQVKSVQPAGAIPHVDTCRTIRRLLVSTASARPAPAPRSAASPRRRTVPARDRGFALPRGRGVKVDRWTVDAGVMPRHADRLLPAVLVVLALGAPAPANAATCSDYPNQAAAQRAHDTRDSDGDGAYCESLRARARSPVGAARPRRRPSRPYPGWGGRGPSARARGRRVADCVGICPIRRARRAAIFSRARRAA